MGRSGDFLFSLITFFIQILVVQVLNETVDSGKFNQKNYLGKVHLLLWKSLRQWFCRLSKYNVHGRTETRLQSKANRHSAKGS